MKKLVAVMLILVIGVVVYAGPKIGFLYSGPIGDFGWTYSHDQARQALPYETVYVEGVTVADVPVVAQRLIEEEGCDMLFCTSWEQLEPIEEIADRFPDVAFFVARIEGEPSDNIWLYLGRMYQARYIAGAIAAKYSNVLGYVAAFPIPEVTRGINAFALGAQSINPDIRVIVRWTYSWYDPAAETEAAWALVSEGVGVLAQHVQGPSVQQVAQQAGVYSVAYNTDMSQFAPDAYLTSCVWNWEPLYRWLIFEALLGHKGSWVWADINTGVVGVDGESEVVDVNLGWSDDELLSMDFWVDGVEAK